MDCSDCQVNVGCPYSTIIKVGDGGVRYEVADDCPYLRVDQLEAELKTLELPRKFETCKKCAEGYSEVMGLYEEDRKNAEDAKNTACDHIATLEAENAELKKKVCDRDAYIVELEDECRAGEQP